mgnify:CR=1 FL=1
MGTVQKVLLYGGTFDPPHNGHMNNLRAALELVRPDKAIVMPAGIPPHKKASTTPGKVRLAMCQCFTALSPAVEVSDWEKCCVMPTPAQSCTFVLAATCC